MMRKTLFVASWKANMAWDAAPAFLTEFKNVAPGFKHEVVLCPSYPHLGLVSANLPDNVKLGGQDVSRYGAGPYTGEVPASMLASIGAKYCIVGHCERRIIGEDDATINKKVKNLLFSGITPMVGVGENLIEYENDQTRIVVERQMRDVMEGNKEWTKVVWCYQPAWSIGTGKHCTPDYTSLIIDFMRKTLQRLSGLPLAGNVQILYGGGVSISNATGYLNEPQCDGIMFGIGATSVKSFADMVTVKFTERKAFQEQVRTLPFMKPKSPAVNKEGEGVST